MDVREQGMTFLWLRVLWRANSHQRAKLNRFFDRWQEQVKMTEKELEKQSHGDRDSCTSE